MKLKFLIPFLLTFPLYPMVNSELTDKKISGNERLVTMMLSLKRVKSRFDTGNSDLKTIPLPLIAKMYAYNVLLDCADARSFDKNPENVRHDICLCARMMGQNKEIIPLIKYMIQFYKEQECIAIQAMLNATPMNIDYVRIGKVNEYLTVRTTLLHRVISYPEFYRVTKLLSWGADPNRINCFQETPLDLALDAYNRLIHDFHPINVQQHTTDAQHLRNIIAKLIPITDLSSRRTNNTICVERMIQQVPSWMVLDLLKYTPDEELMKSLEHEQSSLALILNNKDCTSFYEQSIKEALLARITQYCMSIQVPVQLHQS